MIDAIRQRQINESLNDIRDFNSMAFQIEKRNAALNPENVLPYTQINPEAIQATSDLVQQLLPLLERKKAAMTELKHVPVGMRREYSQGAGEVTNTREVIQLYNAIVKNILTEINQQPAQTSQERIRQLRKALLPADELAKNIYTLISNDILDDRNPWSDGLTSLYLPRFVQALAVYRLMREQLVGSHLAEINQDDVTRKVQDILSLRENRNMMARYRELRLPTAPATATGDVGQNNFPPRPNPGLGGPGGQMRSFRPVVISGTK